MLSLAACTPKLTSTDAAAESRPELRVGVTPNYPPLAFRQNGQIMGVEPQFARKLGLVLGVRVTLVELPWEELIPALRDHRIDVIMSGMSITDERQQLVSFVHPYLRVGQMMALRRADAKRFPNAAAVNRKTTRVGFVTGTTGETYVRQHLQRAHSEGFDAADGAVTALRAKSIDVFIHDSPSIWRITAPENDPQHELLGRYEPLTKEHLAWAVRKDDAQLLARLNTVLAKWNAEGTLDDMLSDWIKIKREQPRAK
jgi:ABC-type amino acid transport substrate-binding protein